MFKIFSLLADWVTYDIFNLTPNSHIAHSLHFFIEDTTKIFFLLVIMIYSIAWIRASLNIERVRDYLKSKYKIQGYFIGSVFGAITPFCSCSSIPLFLGFTTARIPLGVTMSFLITSPMVNEVAIVLLGGILGWKFTITYVVLGIGVGMFGGMLLDALNAERFLKPFIQNVLKNPNESASQENPGDGVTALTAPEKINRSEFAKNELKEIFGRVWKWVIIGVGVGALLHGFVPDSWIMDHLGEGQWWSVPAASILGIPLYANATGIIPVIESLLMKGLPLGTALALMMSTVGASFPEFIMLKQVMEWKLLVILFSMLLVFFTLIGWFFNFFWMTL